MAETRKTRPVSWNQGGTQKTFRVFPEGAKSILLRAIRVVYAVQLADEIRVIHAFQKSKQGIKTPKHEIDLVKERLKRLKEALR